jgi:hypothetical protein
MLHEITGCRLNNRYQAYEPAWAPVYDPRTQLAHQRRNSAWLERAVRVREDGGHFAIAANGLTYVRPFTLMVASSNPVAPIFAPPGQKSAQESRESSEESKLDRRLLCCGLLSTF